jgi:hypothetical protein
MNAPMNKARIVCVSASFCKGPELFKWLQRFGNSFDNNYIYYRDFAFSTEILRECDAILVLNNPSAIINTVCPPENLIAFMMEPGVRTLHPWMYRNLQQYARVYSPVKVSANTFASHGFLGWYPDYTLPQLETMPSPAKEKNISCIVSNLRQLKGHLRRLAFVELLKKEIPGIDFFGKGFNYLPDKMDGLLPYRYSIAMENSSQPYYFTEKINDCFLAWTVPIYYGCENIGKFYPEKSFIKIDIEDPRRALTEIKDIIANDDCTLRLRAVQEARELVLHKYQPLAGAASILDSINAGAKMQVELVPVMQSLYTRLLNIFR